MNKGISKIICLIPVIIGFILLITGAGTSFGGDFYTEIFKAVYAGLGWTCISLGVVGFAICLGMEEKTTIASINNPEKTSDSDNVVTVIDTSVDSAGESNAAKETVTDSISEENSKAKSLLDDGVITEEEYNTLILK